MTIDNQVRSNQVRSNQVRNNQVQETVPGTLVSVSAQVKQEAARWKVAASANRWEVLAVPVRRESLVPRPHQPAHFSG